MGRKVWLARTSAGVRSVKAVVFILSLLLAVLAPVALAGAAGNATVPILVKFKGSATAAQRQAAISGAGGTASRPSAVQPPSPCWTPGSMRRTPTWPA